VGVIGGGKSKPTGKIDIAVMQSLSRQGEVNPIVESYGQVIIDECHHVGAVSFDAILKRVKAKYVLGLTATPIRRDGQQPIIFMRCGPIRHAAARPLSAAQDLEVVPRYRDRRIETDQDVGIQEIFEALADKDVEPFVLHGRMSKKQRSTLVESLNALPGNAPRVLLSTGKLVGEGFDHPALDTLVLAMPVSWKGTLQQYAGRLHRDHAEKTTVKIIDFVDSGHPALLRMWAKRQVGYRAMGYRTSEMLI